MELGITKETHEMQQVIPHTQNQEMQLPQKRIIKPELRKFKDLLEDLIGTRGAYILDENMNLLGKVPIIELPNTIKNMSSAYAVVFDGYIDKNLVIAAERSGVKYLAGMRSGVNPHDTKVELITSNDF